MSIFINDKRQMRAGWRIGLWIVLYVISTVPIVLLSPLLVKVFGQRSPLMEGTFKLLLTLLAVLVSFFLLRMEKRRFASMGLTWHGRALKELAAGLGLGFLMLSVSVAILWSLGHQEMALPEADGGYFVEGFLINAFVFVIVGFNEEIMFRGYVFQTMIEGTNFWISTAFWSLLFGAAHLRNPNVSIFGIANIVLAGLLLSLAYYQTRSLWMPIGIHITWNFTQGWIWGLPVSGTSVHQPLWISKETGPDWWTGGTFGPEGGAVCTIVCILACAWIWKFWRPSEWMHQQVEEAQSTPAFPVREVTGGS